MMNPFNHVIKAGTDHIEDDFFKQAEPLGKPTGVYIAFMANPESAAQLEEYLGVDFKDAEPFSKASMFNGYGCSGTFVRFKTGLRTLNEVKSFVATLA